MRNHFSELNQKYDKKHFNIMHIVLTEFTVQNVERNEWLYPLKWTTGRDRQELLWESKLEKQSLHHIEEINRKIFVTILFLEGIKKQYHKFYVAKKRKKLNEHPKLDEEKK